ncbi:MAG: hypothetical protein RR898_04350 [Clostridium sp.]|uniref:hypothetical protein n=1 Tax=Clostridium sp. TaxID=1506 RepID=UPI002FC99306
MNMTYGKVFKWIIYLFILIAIIKGLSYFMKLNIPREPGILDKDTILSEINKNLESKNHIFKESSISESIQSGNHPILHSDASIIGVEKGEKETIVYGAARINLIDISGSQIKVLDSGYTPLRAVFVLDGGRLKLDKITMSRVAEKNRTQTLLYPIIIHDRYMYEEIKDTTDSVGLSKFKRQ